MDWYVVTKTIKGNRYLYEQRTWREGKRVRTESRYLGREDKLLKTKERFENDQIGEEVTLSDHPNPEE